MRKHNHNRKDKGEEITEMEYIILKSQDLSAIYLKDEMVILENMTCQY